MRAPWGSRPSLVIADVDAITSAPEDELRASAMNALAHGADSMFTPLADELSTSASLRGAGLIANSLDTDRDERDRSELALGALLSAHALDRAGLALHHVLSQTTVRVCGTPHAQTNAALLPLTLADAGAASAGNREAARGRRWGPPRTDSPTASASSPAAASPSVISARSATASSPRWTGRWRARSWPT